MIVYICIAAVGVILAIIWNSIEVDDNGYGGLSSIILATASAVFATLLSVAIINEHPQAIDVYRGKTTLEITYRDSIPIDSVVVFKNKFKK